MKLRVRRLGSSRINAGDNKGATMTDLTVKDVEDTLKKLIEVPGDYPVCYGFYHSKLEWTERRQCHDICVLVAQCVRAANEARVALKPPSRKRYGYRDIRQVDPA